MNQVTTQATSREIDLAGLCARAGVSLVADQAVPGVKVSSLTDDSRRVGPGTCFVAVAGTETDGHRYVRSAVEAGAAVVIVEREVELPANACVLRVADTRLALARLAAVHYGLAPGGTRPMRLIGITGTNGKTTVAWMLRSILRAAERRCALLGTVEYDLITRRARAPLTTPGTLELCRLLAEAADAGASEAVLEVSSHALDQQRCAGLDFAAGVFTNLSGDHLDYHGTTERYFEAKRKLFEHLDETAQAVTNADDERGAAIVSDTRARVVRYGLSSLTSASVDVTVRELDLSLGGSRFVLVFRQPLTSGWHGPAKTGRGEERDAASHPDHGPAELDRATPTRSPTSPGLPVRSEQFEHWGRSEQELAVNLPLVGEHNVMNALAAAATAWALKVPPEAIRAGLEQLTGVPGRLERVEPSGCSFSVFVDYAHTDDALAHVLAVLRGLTQGKLICVFGCGGNRDRSKRPRMAAAVGRLADLALVTSDNPRHEEPEAIIREILPGFEHATRCRVEVCVARREAIATALAQAQPGDTVLIAGKGHEDYQLIGDEVLPFDDREVARACLRKVASGMAEGAA